MQSILGQSHALEILQSALRSGRRHHAWIFAGPVGVGKCTTATEFAKILLDPEAGPNLAGEFESDPAARTAHLIAEESHPDFHLIRKELALYSDNPQLRERKLLNIPLDLLREKMLGGVTGDGRQHEAPAYRTAALNHGKVFIIDEAELLDHTAQNALLKTLEEPPAETYIFLITARPERLLPTIHSRCQIVRFNALDAESMSCWFSRANINVSPEEQSWIEQFSDGAPGIAQLAAEYGLYAWHQTLAPMLNTLRAGRYPATLGITLSTLVDDFAKSWVKNHKNASKDAANKDGARLMLTLLSSYARRGLKADPHNEVWLRIIDVLRETERHLATSVSLKLAFENLVIQWAEGLSSRDNMSVAVRPVLV